MGRGDQFSYEALGHLYDYLTELEEDTDTQINLDVIILCCSFSKETISDALHYYNLDSIDDLHDNTSVIWHDKKNGKVLYQPY